MSDTDEVYQCPACNDPECKRNVVDVSQFYHKTKWMHEQERPNELDIDIWDTWDDEGGSIPESE